MIKTYLITPVPKPRMTQRDRWAKRPAVMRYWAFCEEVRARGVQVPVSGASITFVRPMPKSWSAKRQREMDGAPHQVRPDMSNLLKALEDAVYGEDSVIWQYAGLTKLWGYEGAIIVETVDAPSVTHLPPTPATQSAPHPPR